MAPLIGDRITAGWSLITVGKPPSVAVSLLRSYFRSPSLSRRFRSVPPSRGCVLVFPPRANSLTLRNVGGIESVKTKRRMIIKIDARSLSLFLSLLLLLSLS